MEVLKPGKTPAPENYIGRCRRCGAIIKANASELWITATVPIMGRCLGCEGRVPSVDFYPEDSLEARALLMEAKQYLQEPKP